MRPMSGFKLVVASAALSAAPAALAHATATERANERIVLGFYAALDDADAAGEMKTRIASIAERYLAPDYIQHDEMFAHMPGPGSARDKLVRVFQSMPAMKPGPRPKTVAIMAKGDRVMLLTAREARDPQTGKLSERLIFNMFRVQGGRLAEHWDVQPGAAPAPMTPPAP